MRRITICHRSGSATIVAWMVYSAVLSAQEIERPTWSLTDTWTYKVIDLNTYREGRGRFPSTRKVTITEVRGGRYWADVSIAKEYGERETKEEKWGISVNLNNYERDNATLPWTEMEFLRWPLAVGKSWTFSHPTSDGTRFEWHATVDRWEEVSVPAGRFKAIVVKIEGKGNTPYTAERTVWYAPEAKATVKVDWSGYWGMYELRGAIIELTSFTINSAFPVPQ